MTTLQKDSILKTMTSSLSLEKLKNQDERFKSMVEVSCILVVRDVNNKNFCTVWRNLFFKFRHDYVSMPIKNSNYAYDNKNMGSIVSKKYIYFTDIITKAIIRESVECTTPYLFHKVLARSNSQ